MSKKILIATEKPFAPAARDKVVEVLKKANYEVVVLESYTDKSVLLSAVADANAMIIRSDKVDKEVLDAAKNLELVARAGSGYDNIDCGYAKERGVLAMNTPGQNANAVAELGFGLMVMMARGLYNGKPGTELKGKTLGLHKISQVGFQMARIGKGFGMNVVGFEYTRFDAETLKAAGIEIVKSVEDLYAQSDYLSIHISVKPETKQSIGKKLLMSMPKKGCLVNTARKELIHEAELLEVFESRNDFRYVTDVGPSDDVAKVLKEKYADRFYMTVKKMGAQTAEANANAGFAAAEQIVTFFEKGDRKSYIVNL